MLFLISFWIGFVGVGVWTGWLSVFAISEEVKLLELERATPVPIVPAMVTTPNLTFELLNDKKSSLLDFWLFSFSLFWQGLFLVSVSCYIAKHFKKEKLVSVMASKVVKLTTGVVLGGGVCIGTGVLIDNSLNKSVQQVA